MALGPLKTGFCNTRPGWDVALQDVRQFLACSYGPNLPVEPGHSYSRIPDCEGASEFHPHCMLCPIDPLTIDASS